MSGTSTFNARIEYLQGHNRKTGYQVNDFEAYADESIVTCWRSYKGRIANYNHDTDVSTVVEVSNAIVSPLYFHFSHFQSRLIALSLPSSPRSTYQVLISARISSLTTKTPWTRSSGA
jgi:hypothetical protein